jgi:uncharacterized DUF497 family protein
LSDGGLRCSYAVVTLRRVADLRFELDEIENATNKKKHGVSFEEAQSVSHDERAVLTEDPDDLVLVERERLEAVRAEHDLRAAASRVTAEARAV